MKFWLAYIFIGVSFLRISLVHCPVRYPRESPITSMLFQKCCKYEISRFYKPIRCMGYHESGGDNFHEIEWQKQGGRWRAISFGWFQVSVATAIEYFKAHKIRPPQNIRKWLKNPYNNAEVFCWNFKRQYDIFKTWEGAASAHNMGLVGFRKWRRRNRRSYYWPYINKVKKVMKYRWKRIQRRDKGYEM